MQVPLYGTHGKAKGFCPIRDKTAVNAQGNQTYLQWIVLTTEMFLLQGRPAADEPHILSRKAYIYKLMNKEIANPTTCYSDNTLVAVATAGISEAFNGDLTLGRKHLIALRLLIDRRGGSSILQDMLFGQAMLIAISYVGFGLGEANFPDEVHLKRVTRSFINTFQAMQWWNQRLRVGFEQSHYSEESSRRVDRTTETLPSLSHTRYATNAADLQHYRSSRSKVFGCLRRYLEPRSANINICNKRLHFAVLWIINKLLYDLRDDFDKSTEFIEHFLSDIISGEIPSHNRDSTAAEGHLTPLSIFCIASACAAEHAEKGGILHAWDAVDMLEWMELATKDSQEEVTALLSSWLSNDECNILYIRERRIEEISKEIEKEWLWRQRQHQK